MSRYEDMMHLPHHVSPKRPRMSLYDRAAQFSPFAALVGYEAAIDEAARLTEAPVILAENAVEELNAILCRIGKQLPEPVCVQVTYFRPDGRKPGGVQYCITGVVQKLDSYRQTLVLEGEREVPWGDMLKLEIIDPGEQMKNFAEMG